MTRKASTNRLKPELAFAVLLHAARGKASCFIAGFSFELDARVQPFVKDIHGQVDKNIGHRDQ